MNSEEFANFYLKTDFYPDDYFTKLTSGKIGKLDLELSLKPGESITALNDQFSDIIEQQEKRIKELEEALEEIIRFIDQYPIRSHDLDLILNIAKQALKSGIIKNWR